MRTQDTRMGTRVFSRKRRWRLVKRLVNNERGPHHNIINLGAAATAQTRETALRQRRQVSVTAVRMARRLFKYNPALAAKFWQWRTVQTVQLFTFAQFRLLVRPMFLCLDPISLKICLTNLKIILRRMLRFLFHSVYIPAEVFALRFAKSTLLNDLRLWCRWWEQRFKRLVVLQVRVVPTAARSIVSSFNNTAQLAITPKEQLLCH